MRVFYSGGSPIVECSLPNPDVMLSAYVNAYLNKKRKPDSRTRTVLAVRAAGKAKKGKK